MTIFTQPAELLRVEAVGFSRFSPGLRSRCRAAFTLVEVLMATALSGIVLAGTISTFTLLVRSGLGSAAYATMSSEVALALDRFTSDVRLASDVRWESAQRLTLVLPGQNGVPPSRVTYAFEADAGLAAASGAGRFVRQVDNNPAMILVTHVTADFAFERYRPPVASGDEAAALNDLETKQLAVRLRAFWPGTQAVPAATQLACSARCVLRNKWVGQ